MIFGRFSISARWNKPHSSQVQQVELMMMCPPPSPAPVSQPESVRAAAVVPMGSSPVSGSSRTYNPRESSCSPRDDQFFMLSSLRLTIHTGSFLSALVRNFPVTSSNAPRAQILVIRASVR